MSVACRTGESRGFAFVRYKYADEAQKAVEKLDGKIFIKIFFSVDNIGDFVAQFREDCRWQGYYGPVRQVWTKC